MAFVSVLQDDTKDAEEGEYHILKRDVHVHEKLEKEKEPHCSQDPASLSSEGIDPPNTLSLSVTEEDLETEKSESQDQDPQEATNSSEDGLSRNTTSFQEKEKKPTSIWSDSSRRPFQKRTELPSWWIDRRTIVMLCFLLFCCRLGEAKPECVPGKAPECPSSLGSETTSVEPGHSVLIWNISCSKDQLTLLRMDVYQPTEEYNCSTTIDPSLNHTCSVALFKYNISKCPALSLKEMGNSTQLWYSNVTEERHFCVYIAAPNQFHYFQSSVFVKGETPSAPNIHPVSASATSDTVTLKWAASSSEGTYYIVTCDPPDPEEPNITLNETEVIFCGLAEGKEYYFRIVAVSNNKKGEAVEISAITSTATFVGLHYRTAFWIVVPILVICLIFTCIYHICLKKGKEECKYRSLKESRFFKFFCQGETDVSN